jgi:2-haloacid dehalogenase
VTALDFGSYEALTFDCYGTLIDWETGLLGALDPILGAHRVSVGDDELLEAYARHEAALESGDFMSYRDVVGGSLDGLGRDYGFEPTAEERTAFSDSVGDWPPFPDSAVALLRLKERFKLGVITNCDDDLFARTSRHLGVSFDWVVTAQRAGSYKPARHNFEFAFSVIGLPRERILHVAQSLFHDHVPAKELGLATVWIDRRGGREGSGATPPADAAPDLSVPDMRTLADLATA